MHSLDLTETPDSSLNPPYCMFNLNPYLNLKLFCKTAHLKMCETPNIHQLDVSHCGHVMTPESVPFTDEDCEMWLKTQKQKGKQVNLLTYTLLKGNVS